MTMIGGSDYAVTSDGGDFTVHAVLGLDHEGNPWIVDLWREQTASDVWVETFCDLVLKWKPLGWAEATRQFGHSHFVDSSRQRAYTFRQTNHGPLR
jgi:hypothetical protein